MRKGDTFALTFNKSLELKLGNAGGVRLRYDGEELPQAGYGRAVRCAPDRFSGQAMTEWADHALVLRIGHFRESDLWLKMFCRKTRPADVVRLWRQPQQASSLRLPGMLNSLHCRVKTSGRSGFLNLEEAVLLGGPQSLRRNWRRMGLAANCLRFVEALGVNDDGADEAFLLVEDLRKTLVLTTWPSLLPLFLGCALRGVLGFAPDSASAAHVAQA